MAMKCIVSEDVVLSRPLEGPLSAHIAGLCVVFQAEAGSSCGVF